jgi:hypothetical protein
MPDVITEPTKIPGKIWSRLLPRRIPMTSVVPVGILPSVSVGRLPRSGVVMLTGHEEGAGRGQGISVIRDVPHSHLSHVLGAEYLRQYPDIGSFLRNDDYRNYLDDEALRSFFLPLKEVDPAASHMAHYILTDSYDKFSLFDFREMYRFGLSLQPTPEGFRQLFRGAVIYTACQTILKGIVDGTSWEIHPNPPVFDAGLEEPDEFHIFHQQAGWSIGGSSHNIKLFDAIRFLMDNLRK